MYLGTLFGKKIGDLNYCKDPLIQTFFKIQNGENLPWLYRFEEAY